MRPFFFASLTAMVVFAATARAQVLPVAAGATPVDDRCAAELLSLFPQVRPIYAAVALEASAQGEEVQAALREPMHQLLRHPESFQQVVLTTMPEDRGRRGASTQVHVSLYLLPPLHSPEDSPKIHEVRWGHIVVGIRPHEANYDQLYHEIFDHVAARVHVHAAARSLGALLSKSSFSAGLTKYLELWARSHGALPLHFEIATAEQGTVTIRIDAGSDRRPTVSVFGQTVTIRVSPRTIREEWLAKGHLASDSAQIAGRLSAALFYGKGLSKFPTPWSVPFQVGSHEEFARLQKTLNRQHPVLIAAALPRHPFQQVLALGETFKAIEAAQTVHRLVVIPTPQGDRFVVPTPDMKPVSPKVVTAAGLKASPGEFEPLYGHNILVGQQDAICAEGLDLDPVSGIDSTPRDQLNRVLKLAKYLGLEDHRSQRQLRAHLFHWNVIHGSYEDCFEEPDLKFPAWLKEINEQSLDLEKSWLTPTSALGTASQDRAKWPWAIALIRDEDRTEYVGWLHGIPAASAGRLVDKYRRILETMTPKEVDAFYLGEAQP